MDMSKIKVGDVLNTKCGVTVVVDEIDGNEIYSQTYDTTNASPELLSWCKKRGITQVGFSNFSFCHNKNNRGRVTNWYSSLTKEEQSLMDLKLTPEVSREEIVRKAVDLALDSEPESFSALGEETERAVAEIAKFALAQSCIKERIVRNLMKLLPERL